MDGPQDFTEAIVSAMLGPRDTGVRGQIHQNAVTRGNMPTNLASKILMLGLNPPGALWCVDRLIEPQTMVHYFQSASVGELPGGAKSPFPPVHPEIIQFLTEPPASWAPAPFNTKPQPYMHDIMTRIGSHADAGRMQVVSKDLHFLKSRLWEGIPPMTDQAWRDEHKLDDPANFSQACQLIGDVVDVFKYFDLQPVREAMRDTYNLIYGHLEEFDTALEAKYAAEPPPAAGEEEDNKPPGNDDGNGDAYNVVPPPRGLVKMSALWAEFMRAHFAHMEAFAHSWVTRHLDVLKANVLHGIRTYAPNGPNVTGQYDQVQWALTNMWQDLVENQAHADWAIFVPLEGYRGMSPGKTASGRPATRQMAEDMAREERRAGEAGQGPAPLWVDVDGSERMKQYHIRRREMQSLAMFKQTFQNVAAGLGRRPANDPETLWRDCKTQDDAQREVRLLFRGGGDAAVGMRESWVVEAVDRLREQFEVVVYRMHHGHSDEDWNRFVEKFEADANNWGEGVVGADTVRGKTKLIWRNVGGELSLDGTVALKKHFAANNSEGVLDVDFCLVADEASIESYLNPAATTTPGGTTPKLLSGDIGGFMLAIDVDYDPANDPGEHAEEAPEWAGEMRLRGSTLWGEVMPQYIMQNGCIELMWPMARVHPRKMYTGPVVRAQLQAWGAHGLGL